MIEINKIYNESNCETMARMPDNFVDLTVTSPPYDNLRDYKGYEWDFEQVACELYRVTKPGGVVVWVVNDATINGSETLTSFKQAIYFRENCGFNIHDTMIYEKGNGGIAGSRNCYLQYFEYMLIISKGKPKTINFIRDRKNIVAPREKLEAMGRRFVNGEKKGQRVIKREEYGIRKNIWKYYTGNEETSEHPAIFPEDLAKDHILSWSNEGDLVYDPFMGSGTVAKMCIKTNRNYVGSEISREYCELAERRLRPYIAQCDMFYENISKNDV